MDIYLFQIHYFGSARVGPAHSEMASKFVA